MLVEIIFLVENLSATFILWLGLYIITRDLPWRHESPRAWQRPAMLTGSGLLLLSIYLYGVAMQTVATQPQDFLRWQRLTLWGIPIAVALYFRAAMLFMWHGRKEPLWSRLAYEFAFLYAVLLAIGIASGFLLGVGAMEARASIFQPYYTPMRAPLAIVAYFPFVLAGLLGSAALLLYHYKHTPPGSQERQKVRLLAIGSLFFLTGAIATFILARLAISTLPKQLGDYLSTAGAAIIGYAIARYNALDHEQMLAHDFWHSLTSVSVTVAVYLLAYHILFLLFGYSVQPLTVILLSFLAVLTQTPYNWDQAIFDRLLLPRWAIGYRRRLVLMRQDLLMAPDPRRLLDSAEEEFVALVQTVRVDELEDLIRREVEHIFQYSHFDSTEVLAASDLHELQIAQDVTQRYARQHGVGADTLTTQQRAETLRSLLESAIEMWFCPPDAEPTDPVRIEQVILRKKYIDGLSRTGVERYVFDEYDVAVTGGAYSRQLKRARQRLARVLFDRELAHSSSPA